MAEENLASLLSMFERHWGQRDEDGSGETEQSEASYQSDLIRALELFSVEYDFQRGDLVQWKPGMQNKSLPTYGKPMIVVEVLEEPITNDEVGSSSPSFREPLNLLGAIWSEEGRFLIGHYDKRRFEPFNDD